MPKKRTTKKKENEDEAEGEGKPPTKQSKKNHATSVKANQDNPERSRPRHKLRDGNEKNKAPSVDPPVWRSPRRKVTGRKARGRKAHNKKWRPLPDEDWGHNYPEDNPDFNHDDDDEDNLDDAEDAEDEAHRLMRMMPRLMPRMMPKTSRMMPRMMPTRRRVVCTGRKSSYFPGGR